MSNFVQIDKSKLEKIVDKAKGYDTLHFLYCGTHLEPECKSPPHQVYIELTNGCNYNCTHCPQSTQRRKVQHMDIELYKKIIDELSEFNPFIDLYMQGEPLVYPKIVEAVKYAADKGLKPRITTNSSLLTKEKSIALIEAGLDKIEFSCSAASTKVYEKIYAGASFEKFIDNVLNFLIENAARGFPVHTRPTFVLEEATAEDEERFYSLFGKLPFDDVYVSPLINMFGWNSEIDLSSTKKKSMKEWDVCKCPWRQFGIQANGDVRGCIFDYDSRYIVGNANDSSILELWNSESMQEFRKNIMNKDYDKIETDENLPLCTECSQIWEAEFSEASSTTQKPNDFAKEAAEYFANKDGGFKAKYSPYEEKLEKMEYLKQNIDEWKKVVLG